MMRRYRVHATAMANMYQDFTMDIDEKSDPEQAALDRMSDHIWHYNYLEDDTTEVTVEVDD